MRLAVKLSLGVLFVALVLLVVLVNTHLTRAPASPRALPQWFTSTPESEPQTETSTPKPLPSTAKSGCSAAARRHALYSGSAPFELRSALLAPTELQFEGDDAVWRVDGVPTWSFAKGMMTKSAKVDAALAKHPSSWPFRAETSNGLRFHTWPLAITALDEGARRVLWSPRAGWDASLGCSTTSAECELPLNAGTDAFGLSLLAKEGRTLALLPNGDLLMSTPAAVHSLLEKSC